MDNTVQPRIWRTMGGDKERERRKLPPCRARDSGEADGSMVVVARRGVRRIASALGGRNCGRRANRCPGPDFATPRSRPVYTEIAPGVTIKRVPL